MPNVEYYQELDIEIVKKNKSPKASSDVDGDQLVAKDLIARVPATKLTVAGLEMMANYYSREDKIDLRIFKYPCPYLQTYNQFGFFSFEKFIKSDPGKSQIEDALEASPRKRIGFIIAGDYEKGSGKSGHMIPVMICKDESGVKQMLIFDSVTLPRDVDNYESIADSITKIGYKVYLNNGTRQVDQASCGTDAIIILRDALNLSDDLIKTMLSGAKLKEENLKEGDEQHLYRFNLPAELMLTTQHAEPRLSEVDQERALENSKSKKSLREKLELDRYKVQQFAALDLEHRATNHSIDVRPYLYNKSVKMAKIIDEEVERMKKDEEGRLKQEEERKEIVKLSVIKDDAIGPSLTPNPAFVPAVVCDNSTTMDAVDEQPRCRALLDRVRNFFGNRR